MLICYCDLWTKVFYLSKMYKFALRPLYAEIFLNLSNISDPNIRKFQFQRWWGRNPNIRDHFQWMYELEQTHLICYCLKMRIKVCLLANCSGFSPVIYLSTFHSNNTLYSRNNGKFWKENLPKDKRNDFLFYLLPVPLFPCYSIY